MSASATSVTQQSPEVILKMEGIQKSFGIVPVLKNVDLSVHKGEVLALMGENGAGKSTLMKILCGIHQASAGIVKVDGETVTISSVEDAMKMGFVLIHQELNLLDNVDVAGNLFLGREPKTRFGLLDNKKLHQNSVEVLLKVGLNIAPTTPVNQLSLAQQQLIEIAKALSQKARILIMDEPTSSLTLKETERLFETIGELKSQGVTIIYISHRLNEIMAIADRAVVLKDGQNSGVLEKADINHNNLIKLMVGRDIKISARNAGNAATDKPGFYVKDLITDRYPTQKLSFNIKPGEILGISGLIGSGRTELAETLYGIRKVMAGQLLIGEQAIQIQNPRDAIANGIFLVPEDRKKQGVFTTMSVAENIGLPNLKSYARFRLVNEKKQKESAENQVQLLHIKTPSLNALLTDLSGGNQQKVAIGKWLSRTPSLIVFDEPTRGVDVGAKNEIYDIMRNLASNGIMVLVISSDMEEIIQISDRLLIMHEGRISGELLPPDFTEEKIMLYAVGHT